MLRKTCSFVVCPLLACMVLSVVHAEESPQPAWHQGVSEQAKEKALALFLEGKQYNEQLLLGEARDKYEEALKLWEHPQLRFYLARVHKRMGFPLLAHESLKKTSNGAQTRSNRTRTRKLAPF